MKEINKTAKNQTQAKKIARCIQHKYINKGYGSSELEIDEKTVQLDLHKYNGDGPDIDTRVIITVEPGFWL